MTSLYHAVTCHVRHVMWRLARVISTSFHISKMPYKLLTTDFWNWWVGQNEIQKKKNHHHVIIHCTCRNTRQVLYYNTLPQHNHVPNQSEEYNRKQLPKHCTSDYIDQNQLQEVLYKSTKNVSKNHIHCKQVNCHMLTTVRSVTPLFFTNSLLQSLMQNGEMKKFVV